MDIMMTIRDLLLRILIEISIKLEKFNVHGKSVSRLTDISNYDKFLCYTFKKT